MKEYDVAVFDRYDLWLTYPNGKRLLYKTFTKNDLNEVEKYLTSRRFKKLLKTITRVEVVQVYSKIDKTELTN